MFLVGCGCENKLLNGEFLEYSGFFGKYFILRQLPYSMDKSGFPIINPPINFRPYSSSIWLKVSCRATSPSLLRSEIPRTPGILTHPLPNSKRSYTRGKFSEIRFKINPYRSTKTCVFQNPIRTWTLIYEKCLFCLYFYETFPSTQIYQIFEMEFAKLFI